MITVIRTAEINQQKFMEAVQWAAQVTAHIHQHHSGNTQLNRTVGGLLSEIHWITTYENMGAMEEFRKKLDADSVYQQLFQQATSKELFVAGTIYDQIYSTMAFPS